MAAQTYTTDTIAKLLDLSPRRVQQLVQEGVIPRKGRGQFELVPSVQAYVRYLRTLAEQHVGTTDQLAEKARLVREKADAQAIRNARERGELVEADSLDRALIALATIVSSRLLGMGQRLGQLLAADGTPAKCAQVVDDAVKEALTDLADSAERVEGARTASA